MPAATLSSGAPDDVTIFRGVFRMICNFISRFVSVSSLRTALVFLVPVSTLSASAFAGTISITSPSPSSTHAGAVSLTASVQENVPFHIEVWDNGAKLGNVFASAVSGSYTLAQGSHTTSVLAVTSAGSVLDSKSVTFSVGNSPASGVVSISSPTPNSTSINAVTITASVGQSPNSHLEIWDNGFKLGDVPADSVNGVYVLPNGSHVLTVEAVTNGGALLSQSSVNYTVAANCSTSSSLQCDLDQVGADNSQDVCNPAEEAKWVANACGSGVQGTGGSYPVNTGVELISQPGVLPNLGNLTLNGHSLHLSEVQGNGGFSNVLFRGQSPNITSMDSHWTLDQYVYLPDPTAHQAFEMDAQASINGIWSKFYTECAFNMTSGTGYWAVFDSNTGGWIFLNGKSQGGQTPPVVPCNRNQFAQPWTGSSVPSFSGWHHIAWSFLRNDDGTVTFVSLTFDGTTTQINFKPNSASGGNVSDRTFSALVQLDGVTNEDRKHDLVDAYVSQVTLTHTP